MKHNQDPYSLDPNYRRWVYWVGSDGSLWRMRHGVETPQQVPSPGDLTRVALSPDTSVWCVDARGGAWVMRSDFTWSRVTIHAESSVISDVDVAADKSAWFVEKNGRYFVQRSTDSKARYVASLMSFSAITGIEEPIFADDSPRPAGRAWGVTRFVGDRDLIYSDGWWRPNPQPTIVNVADVSTAPSNLWMVKTDGTVWTTIDCVTQLRRGDLIAARIAGDFNDNAWCVSPDGRAWVWEKVVTPAPPPPLPPPPPPQPEASSDRPVLGVHATGSGESTVFKLTGSRFRAGAQVTVRGVRIGDGQVFEWYWLTQADQNGKLDFPITLPCLPGVIINFSANDGRIDMANHTDRLWSNTVPAMCP